MNDYELCCNEAYWAVISYVAGISVGILVSLGRISKNVGNKKNNTDISPEENLESFSKYIRGYRHNRLNKLNSPLIPDQLYNHIYFDIADSKSRALKGAYYSILGLAGMVGASKIISDTNGYSEYSNWIAVFMMGTIVVITGIGIKVVRDSLNSLARFRQRLDRLYEYFRQHDHLTYNILRPSAYSHEKSSYFPYYLLCISIASFMSFISTVLILCSS